MKKVFNFLNGSYNELQRVQWPDKQTTIRLTGFVIGVSLGVGIYITALDYVFNEGLSYIINR